MSEPIRRMLVAYDIVDDQRRDKVADKLSEHGERVQYSVFMVDGRPASFVRLQADLEDLIELEEDAVMFCDLGSKATTADRAVTQIGVVREFIGDDDGFIV